MRLKGNFSEWICKEKLLTQFVTVTHPYFTLGTTCTKKLQPEVLALLGCYAAYVGSRLLTFQDSTPCLSSRTKRLLDHGTDRLSRNIIKQLSTYAVWQLKRVKAPFTLVVDARNLANYNFYERPHNYHDKPESNNYTLSGLER